MRKHLFTYIPATVLLGLATVGGLQSTGYYLDTAIPYKTAYAFVLSACVYAILASNEQMFSLSFDGLFVKRALATTVGLAIIGTLSYFDYEHQYATTWSALLSSVLYIYMVLYGVNLPPEINPVFLEG
jgi:hypothetical protein